MIQRMSLAVVAFHVTVIALGVVAILPIGTILGNLGAE